MEILIVDDEKDLGTFVRIALSKEAPGFSISVVESGDECLEFIQSHPVDCIISDYQMPGMNGMELLLNLRNQGDDTPVIFLTGQGNEGVAREAFKNGAFDYFTKDIGFAHFTRIINSIEQAVSLRSARARHLKVEEAIRNTAEGVSAKTGEMFFRSLVQYLAKALGVRFAFIGEIDEKDPGQARTVAFWAGEGFADTFEYQLVNTPCDNVVRENMRCYPKDLKRLFPKDEYSARFDVESYAGTPLWDSTGRVIGLLVVFDSKPIQDEDNVKALLKVFASRASAELERLKADKVLKESEAMFRSLSAEALVGIYLVQDMRFRYVNPEFCGMLGYSEGELTRVDALDVVHPDDRELTRECIGKVLSGESAHYHRRWLRMDGGVIDVEATAAYTTYNGRPALIGTAADVTAKRLLERQKDDFYEMVTHDLKSPLTAIMGHARLLAAKDDKRDMESSEMISAISDSSKKLYRLVEDFLSVSQMEAGKLNLKLAPSDISQTIKEVHADLERDIQVKRLTYNEEMAAGPPTTLMVDRKLVQRAVYNLLQNAIKYTPQGGRITLKVESASGKAEDYAVISVTDTGHGIPKEDQERVFEKYYRCPMTMGAKGTGLGLAIVKAVAEAHGGHVELQSEAGKGSTFKIFLPVNLSYQQTP